MDAVGVLAGMDKGLQSIGTDICVLKSKFLSFNFNGASVNMGTHNGVAKKVQEWIGNH